MLRHENQVPKGTIRLVFKYISTLPRRRDPPTLGTDEWDRPEWTFYECQNAKCMEVHSLKCKRRCKDVEIPLDSKSRVVMFAVR